jgi:hypothetical protein
MKQGWNEFALGWFAGIFGRKLHGNFIDSSFPIGAWLSWNAGLPHHEFGGPIPLAAGTSIKSHWMITAPSLAFFLQTANSNSRGHDFGIWNAKTTFVCYWSL